MEATQFYDATADEDAWLKSGFHCFYHVHGHKMVGRIISTSLLFDVSYKVHKSLSHSLRSAHSICLLYIYLS